MVARRVISWLSQAPLVLDDADAQFYRRFLRSLARQVRHLRHTVSQARDGVPRLQAAIALCYAALCMARQQRHIRAGAPADIQLTWNAGKRYRGSVVGLGWAVLPENGTSVMGLPRVEKSIDWVRLAARFPVRIKVENPDESFRIGASAVVTVGERVARSTAGR